MPELLREKYLTALEYRMKAEECHLMALKARTVHERVVVDRVAELWSNLASTIEEARPRRS